MPSLPRHPLAAALALGLGIAIAPILDAHNVTEPLRWAAAFALSAVAAMRAPRLALAAVVAIGAARGATPPRPVPAGASVDDRVEDRIEGVIAGPVVHTERGTGARLVPDGAAASIWLWTEEPLAAGERIAAHGLLRTPGGSRGPAQPDRAAALAVRGAELELVARHLERIADSPSLLDHLWRWADATQRAGSATIEDAGGDPPARAALRGIAIGDRVGVPEDLDARWRAAGIYHVLSVSGLHLAVVAGLAFMLLRRLAAASPWGGRNHPARWAAPPALALALAYTLVTGAQLATLRALIVVAVVMIAQALDRPVRLIDALGFAAIAMLALRPADLHDPGFQLSFTAALTLALLPPSTGGGLRARLARGLAASVWIAITTAPITAHHFHEVTMGGVVGNLILTPIVELLALPLSLAGLALGWDAPIALATTLVEIVDTGAGLLAHVAPVGRIAVVSAPLAAVLAALSLALAARAWPNPRAAAAAWLALCAAWALGRTPPPPGALRVTFLDVGQGDAALVELPDGAAWLIDAGGHADARTATAAASTGVTIRRALTAAGHRRVALAIVSHPHPDHYLGLAALDVPVDELWTVRDPEPPTAPTATAPTATAPTAARGHLPRFDDLTATLAARGTRTTHPPLGVARREAGVELIVWAPRYHATSDTSVTSAIEAADPVRSVNDNSLVVELRYRGRSILFTGDLEAEGEAALVEAGVARADIVKVPHHGSATSSTAALVHALHPSIAVISCGRANRFNFPAPAVVERWRAAGAEVVRTDLDGAVTVTISDGGALSLDVGR